ncbi:MAG TPA: pitrilysin family protein [Dehalococcoidia bacterium]|jgi:zinc protease
MTADILPFAATEATLANGLRVIVVPTGFPNLVSLQIPVQAGSRNEVEPGKSGFAHFFEHMMFRGTPRFPPDAYEALITRAGARQNAYTTDDYTNYHITFAKEDLETMLEIEADRFMHLAYGEPAFRTEARAILGEYNKSASNPLTKLFEVQREHAFSVHTYKHTTMGFLQDIEAMPEQFEYSLAFFKRWYRPEYTTVIVAGDVDPQETLALVERHWGGWRAPEQDAPPPAIPQEPEPHGPVTAHVPWPVPTLPWVTIAFRGPAFSESEPDWAALDTLLDLHFGETSELYHRLVEEEQIVDRLAPHLASTQDPELAAVLARLKRPEDAPRVRDAILATIAALRREPVAAERLAEAKSHNRYAFARSLDNSESIAGTLARFVRFRRSYDTLNNLFRVYDALTPDDLLAAARRYLTDARLVQTTLSYEPLAEALAELSPLASFTPAAGQFLPAQTSPGEAEGGPAWLLLPSPLPLLRLKLLFDAGSSNDPPGKEGLAELVAAMIVEAGSQELRYEEITRALFPLAASFELQVDREQTVFSGTVHRDVAERFLDIALPQLLRPGLRESDFARIKETQRNALVQDLRGSNDEELGKERLQANCFSGTPYGHPALGSVSGIEAITLDDVRAFIGAHYTRANLTVGLAGDAPEPFVARLRADLSALPFGGVQSKPSSASTPLWRRRSQGIQVEIIDKDTRATAISFGHPIEVTRSHPDFAALWLARAWLGEHRASLGRLYQRLREARGLNYGDYAYVEAFPGAMYRLFPEPNVARRAQLFEVWIRPVEPQHAVFAFKLALYELRHLIEQGLSEEEFAATRAYLMKNVFLMTRTQGQQLGYALDQRWYGLPEFTGWMRGQLQTLTVEAVNVAVRRHLSAENLFAVFVAGDAASLREQLLSDEPATIAYDAPKPSALLEEDRIAGALPLNLTPDAIRITLVDAVFA